MYLILIIPLGDLDKKVAEQHRKFFMEYKDKAYFVRFDLDLRSYNGVMERAWNLGKVLNNCFPQQ